MKNYWNLSYFTLFEELTVHIRQSYTIVHRIRKTHHEILLAWINFSEYKIFWFGKIFGAWRRQFHVKCIWKILFVVFDWSKTVNLWNLCYIKFFETLVNEMKSMRTLIHAWFLKNGATSLKEVIPNNEIKKNSKLKANEKLQYKDVGSSTGLRILWYKSQIKLLFHNINFELRSFQLSFLDGKWQSSRGVA